MKKKWLFAFLVAVFASSSVLATVKISGYLYEAKLQREREANATIIVDLKEDMLVPFASKAKVSDFITNINGEIEDDYEIDTSEIGKKEIEFKYLNDENIRVTYSYEVEIVDETPPLVWLSGSYSVTTNFSGKLEDKILCADDYDDEPDCTIEGEYDTTKKGNYDLKFVAEDSSGNQTIVPFTLKVTEPSSSSSTYNPSKYQFSSAIERFKTPSTSLGIDVSSWQGDIDFNRVKESGVEFAFVRVGSKWGMDGEYFLDSKFEANMEGFNKVGIPVGAYFYSYARNEDEAREEAKWVIDKLKKYEVDLPVAFDFEDWSKYNDYKMSLYRLNRNATVFIETLEDAGYEGMLYGSLNYLNKMWDKDYETYWVAHYTNNANYEGVYKYWQFSATGGVDGINAYVDLDIMYK